MKYPIPLALILCGSAAATAAEPTHCGSAEEVVYSCRLRNSPKIVSLCASKGLAAGPGYSAPS